MHCKRLRIVIWLIKKNDLPTHIVLPVKVMFRLDDTGDDGVKETLKAVVERFV